jgi:hypothetical protein
MPPAKRHPDVSWLPVLLPNAQALLDQGEATRGCTATARGGHIIVGRVDAAGADPRFRMTLLKGEAYGLSLYRRKKWDQLPFQATVRRYSERLTARHRATNLQCLGQFQ